MVCKNADDLILSRPTFIKICVNLSICLSVALSLCLTSYSDYNLLTSSKCAGITNTNWTRKQGWGGQVVQQGRVAMATWSDHVQNVAVSTDSKFYVNWPKIGCNWDMTSHHVSVICLWFGYNGWMFLKVKNASVNSHEAWYNAKYLWDVFVCLFQRPPVVKLHTSVKTQKSLCAKYSTKMEQCYILY